MMSDKGQRSRQKELTAVTARPERSLPPSAAAATDEPIRLLLARQRRILFGLAVAILALGIIAVAQSFAGSVFASNREPQVRRIAASEPARPPAPPQAIDGLLF